MVHVRQFDWETVYAAAEYIDLISTFSGHIAMADWQRERLYSNVSAKLAERPDRTLRGHWGAALHIAHRREPPGEGIGPYWPERMTAMSVAAKSFPTHSTGCPVRSASA